MVEELSMPTDVEHLKTCFLCTFPPRECGIASFTNDLATAMDKRFNPKLKSQVVAIDEDEDYNYPEKVVMHISKDDILHYLDVAKKLNENDNIKIVCVQHEFGLFGGEYGSFLIPFLEALKKPAVITFHTVLPDPDEYRLRITNAIADRAGAIIVPAQIAKQILIDQYRIDENKVFAVHHGIPNVSFKTQEEFKEKLDLKDKIVLCNHGMVSRGKGIEYAIKALPPLIEKYPNLVFFIIGETHPTCAYEHGKKYRKELEQLVKDLNLENHVRFINEYMPLPDLIEYMQASDIYLFTNLEKAQISSGVLCRALGCGRAIVSTPIVYSEELLADNRGVLVNFKDPNSFTEAIDKLLSNPELRKEIEKKAYFYSRQMIWSNVALNYLKIFNKVVQLRKETTEKFPLIKLDHLKRMTDNFGALQFAQHTTPDRGFGYTLDDNSRALIVSVLYNRLFKSDESSELASKYLDFLEQAQEENGNFKNQFKNQEELTNPYSEDSFGRALSALGFTIDKSLNFWAVERAKKIFWKSFNYIDNIQSPRAKSFILAGLCRFHKSFPNKEMFEKINQLADSLVVLYKNQSSGNWHWFEPYLTYANSKIPESLLLAFEITKNHEYLELAEKTFKFLADISFIDEKLSPVGQEGWFVKGNKRAFFDQQPIDASTLVQTFLIAHRITKKQEYYDKAVLAFNWFLGNNHLNQMIYDDSTGGCFDGLGEHSLNFNQGAESTVSYLIARLFLEEIKRDKKLQEKNQKLIEEM
jgi:glycosyltransferase involved in cell wall biosynthesis